MRFQKGFRGSQDRQQKKEAELVNNYLSKLTLAFLQYCIKIGEVDFSPITEEIKMKNFREGILPGESRSEKVASEFIRLNFHWKKFAHSRKWIYHKVNLDGFEKAVAANIQQLKPMQDDSKIIPLHPQPPIEKTEIILAQH